MPPAPSPRSVLGAAAALLVACAGPAPEAPAPADPAPAQTLVEQVEPHWIWCRAEARAGERATFRRAFEVSGAPREAVLWATADNQLEVRLNGHVVCESSRWEVPVEADVTELLVPGTNEVVVWAQNGDGPAGVCLELAFEDGGTPRRVQSSSAWEVLGPADGVAVDLGPRGGGVWGRLGAATPALPRLATPAEAITAPEGFEVTLLHSASPAREGSWVALAPDPAGRLYVSSQRGGLFRVTLPPVRAAGPCLVEELALELPGAQGLLWAFDALYAVTNAGGGRSGLHRLTDTDGDDLLDRVELLRRLEGDGEHGPHAVVLAPDGAHLYVVCGNYTKLPDLDASLVPEVWARDRLLPTILDPRGHATDVRAPAGWIARTDPDGRGWTLVASGLRNAYDLAFDRAGELFTFDSDMEWDVGLPWYRPTRVLQVTAGAEFGWRTGSAKWPLFAPDAHPTALAVGRGSPTGILFGHDTAFPAPWREALLLGDWSEGRILGATLERVGAGHAGAFEPLVEGAPLAVTDLATPGDGALYFTTGGRGTQTGLYRVRWTGAPAAPRARGGGPLPDALAVRRRLEDPATADLAAAWLHLDDADRVLRFAARTALERRAPGEWRAEAWEEARPRAAIEATLALVRADPDADAERLLARVLDRPWERFERDERRGWLRALELVLVRAEGARVEAADVARLAALFPTGDAPADRELARVLAALGAPELDRLVVPELEFARTQEHAIALAFALAHWEGAYDDAHWERFAAWLADAPRELTGGESCAEYLELVREAAYANAGRELPAAVAVEAATPTPTTVLVDWTPAALLPLIERARDGEGSRLRGADVYRRASCHDCHRLGNEGGAQGPDLTGVRWRLGARDLAVALLEPSADVSDQYLDTEVWCGDELVVGRLVLETEDFVVLRTTPDDERVQVAREEITLQRPHALSRMPTDLLDPFEEREVLDLLAYLLGDSR